jgi:N-acetyl sugar amidotransferase
MQESRTCARCVFNSTIPGISFDSEGVCSYCRQYEILTHDYPTGPEGRAILQATVDRMKKDGRGRAYDVVIGVSGGCDSSYMLHFARKELGLRVLAAHFDNTYNSRIAVENIQRMLEALDIDLYTDVADNAEFQRVFRSFLISSVPEIDTPSDIALAAVHYRAAAKHRVKWIWEGHSFRTEGISPPGWFYMDSQYVRSIHSRYGDGRIKSLPELNLARWMKWMLLDKIRKFRPLYYLDYNKESTKRFLTEEYGWQWYGGHHMENRTAYFVNNYYLPRKFGIDLRYAEFSALIRSGQLSREEALAQLAEPKPFDEAILAEVKQRVGFSDAEWDAVMKAPLSHYTQHRTYKQTFERLRPFFFSLYKMGYVTRSFYEKYCVMKEAAVPVRASLFTGTAGFAGKGETAAA